MNFDTPFYHIWKSYETMRKAISKNIEYWKIDEILDVLKVIIDPDLIGQAKQIKKYRDWVAHRNIKKKSPPNVVPERAYSVLAEIGYPLKLGYF